MRFVANIIDRLVQLQIKQIFFLPGGGAMHLNDALAARKEDIEPVVCLHEQACGIRQQTLPSTTVAPKSAG